MAKVRGSLRRIHIWLGWIVGIPILLWVVSGLIMVVRPIEEVRGSDLLSEASPVRTDALVAPSLAGVPFKALELKQTAAGPRWVVTLADGGKRLADPATGAWLPALSAPAALAEVTARYRGEAKVASVRRTDPAKPPLDLRREIPAWQIRMTDGTHFYVDSRTGEIAATRTRFWRVYDWMWGLHIMDLKTREDTHNPLVIFFAIVALITTILALVLLPMTLKRRRNGAARNS